MCKRNRTPLSGTPLDQGGGIRATRGSPPIWTMGPPHDKMTGGSPLIPGQYNNRTKLLSMSLCHTHFMCYHFFSG